MGRIELWRTTTARSGVTPAQTEFHQPPAFVRELRLDLGPSTGLSMSVTDFTVTDPCLRRPSARECHHGVRLDTKPEGLKVAPARILYQGL